MKYKPYLKNHLKVSQLGFGAWPLGNLEHGQQMSEAQGVTLVTQAVESGINFFDTAPNYATGRSETILGIALKEIRTHVVINTKFGHKADGSFDFSEKAIRPSITESLRRLQTGYIDSVLLHNPSMDILLGKTNHFSVFEDLKSEGLIKGYGVSIDTLEELEATLEHLEVDVIELLYNVFSQATRPFFEIIKQKGIALIIKVPLDSGWLTGKFNKASTFAGIRSRWTPEDISRRATLTQGLKDIVDDDRLTPYALGFLWSYDAITTVIPGIRTKEQLEDHLTSLEKPFSAQHKKAFEAFYDKHIKGHPLPW